MPIFDIVDREIASPPNGVEFSRGEVERVQSLCFEYGHRTVKNSGQTEFERISIPCRTMRISDSVKVRLSTGDPRYSSGWSFPGNTRSEVSTNHTVIVESTNQMDGGFVEDQKMALRYRKFVNCTSTIAKIRYGGLDNAADQIGRFRPPYCFYPFPKTRNPPTTSRPREPAKADFALVHFHG